MLVEYLPEIKTSDSFSIHLNIKDFNNSHAIDNVNIKTNSDFVVKYSFYNYTAKMISVKTRDGLCIEIQPTPQIGNSFFIIRKNLQINNYSLESAIKYFTNLSAKDNNSDIQKIKDLLIKSTNKPYLSEFNINLDYKFSAGSLLNSYNGIYHSLTDIVLSTKTSLECAEHPYSPLYLNIGDFKKEYNYNSIKKNEAIFKVRFFSKENKKLYFYCLGELHQLESEIPFAKKGILVTNAKSNLLEVIDTEEYIEVFSTYSTNAINKRKGICIRRFSLEEAEKILGVYSDMYKANKRGDHETYINGISEELKRKFNIEKTQLENESLTIKKELAKVEKELQEQKQKIEKENMKLENERIELEKDKLKQNNISKNLKIEEEKLEYRNRQLTNEMEKFKQTLELENFKHKLNHDNNKIINENKMLSKKNFIEFLKIAPAILGSGIALISLIKSFKK